MNRIAEKIRDARIKAGLTEKQLAKKCGLSVGYIIQIESGRKIVKEQLADKILKSLGEKVSMQEPTEEFEPQAVVKKPQAKSVPVATSMVEPNAQWADALSGVIKKYPVYDGQGKKVVTYKELPILSKKIEGHHPDKIMYVQAPNDNMSNKRIMTKDVLTLTLSKEIENNGIYVFELDKKRDIGVLRKEGNKQVSIVNQVIGTTPKLVSANQLKVIGKVIKVEFNLK